MSYADSISPEFYELERRAIFPRAGSTSAGSRSCRARAASSPRTSPLAQASVIVVRGADGEVRAFHNVCRHRGNKILWDHSPTETARGICRQFVCKYHGWRYGLDGQLNFVLQEEEFFDLDKDDFGLIPVHCDVWEGFIFVNLDESHAQSLREFLGPMVTGLDGYPVRPA